MRLSAPLFNRLANGAGMQQFGYRSRSACPCVNPSSGNPKSSCPVCGGKGHVWDAEETRGVAIMTALRMDKAIRDLGVYEPGDAMMTVTAESPLYDLKQYDRIRCVNSTHEFSEALSPGLNDKLRTPVVGITRVWWLATDGVTVVEGGIPDVGDDGTLTWTAGPPPANTTYTVEGERWDEFFVWLNQATNRNHGGGQLPRRVPVRRFDLLGR